MNSQHAVNTLTRSFLGDYPREAAREIESLPPESVAPVLAEQPLSVLTRVWEHLLPDVAEGLLLGLPDELIGGLLTALDPGQDSGHPRLRSSAINIQLFVNSLETL